MQKGPHRLENGSKVAIVGGGPAGSLFALYLLRYAGERNIRPAITLYEERKFKECGPTGCKGCAGILSISFLKNLRELGLKVPEEIIQSKIEQYAVHSPYTSISISNPEREIEIVSICRGGGPAKSTENIGSFDGWLLEQVKRKGVCVVNQRVSGIDLGEETSVEVAGDKDRYDLVVLATGINNGSTVVRGLNYIPPEARRMAMAELYVGAQQVRAVLGNVAHVFLIPHSGMIFGTLVPKGPFVNVSVLSGMSVVDFLKNEFVRPLLPIPYEIVCHCRPLAAIHSAGNYYADRFVAVGDASVSRLYKDGIGSSLLTARQAARTIVHHGFSSRDFHHHYGPLCKGMNQDNRWGKLLFWFNDKTKDSRTFLLAQHRLIGDEQYNIKGSQYFTKAAWGMFSGTYSYREIWAMVSRPISFGRLLWVLLKGMVTLLPGTKRSYPRRLHVGSRKVLILGSGFGGTYVLRHLVPSLNRNENVETTMISDENFFLFSPLLHQVAMGGIETRHIAYPIRRLHWRDRFNFVHACVEGINLPGREVNTTAGAFHFDYLVLALGSVPDVSRLNVPGPNLFTLKTLHDSMLIRNHIIGIFEQASAQRDPEKRQHLLTFVVSGAGYIGVQLVTELRDFIFRNLVKVYRAIDPSDIRIILVEAEARIVADLDPKLGDYAATQLERMGIDIRVRSQITRVWEDRVEVDGNVILPTKTVIWGAGMVANPRIAEIETRKDCYGRIRINEYLEVPGAPGVYALGDCAHFEDPKSGRAVPMRAYVAFRQARIVAHNLLAAIRGSDLKAYRYSGIPEILSLGSSRAVLRLHRIRIYGFPARLVWLILYSSLVTGIYNRVRVLTDWLLSLVFGRDIAYLKLGKPEGRNAEHE
jgi:NADH dehydrogenase